MSQPATDAVIKRAHGKIYSARADDLEDFARILEEALRAARWYVERSQHVTDLGRMKRDRDLVFIDAALGHTNATPNAVESRIAELEAALLSAEKARDEAVGALRELVRLEDLGTGLRRGTPEYEAMLDDYCDKNPGAWTAARAALTTPTGQQVEP